MKAEIICFYHSKILDIKFRDPSECGKISLNLAVGRSRTVTEEEMFEMSKPDIPATFKHENDSSKLHIFRDMHFLFNFVGPTGLTILIIFALVAGAMPTHNFMV